MLEPFWVDRVFLALKPMSFSCASERYSGRSPVEALKLASFVARSNSSVRIFFVTHDDGMSLKIELPTTHDCENHSRIPPLIS